MRVFLTGATGFIGSRVLPELLAAGHQVLGLTRSEAGAAALAAAGAEAHRGTLEDPASLVTGAERADAVVHTAFDHDFSNFVANCEKDRRAIAAMGAALRGSARPLIITSGVGIGLPASGGAAVEDVFNAGHANPRIASEQAGNALLDAGVDVRVVRLPQVHDTRRQGLISPYIAIAREKRVAAYVDDGANRWSAAHVSDVARVYARVLDRGAAGLRYHAVGEEGVPARAIAAAVAAGLGVPTASLSAAEAPAHFGWFALFAGMDLPASAALTRERLGWQPSGPDLLTDLRQMDYTVTGA